MLSSPAFFKPPSDKFIIVSSRLGSDSSVQMLSKDPEFLKEKWGLISEYTKKVDPNAALGDFVIQEITDGEYKGLSTIQLDKILPRLVRIHYGEVFIQGHRRGNCHGAALMAAGVFPAMSYMDPLHDAWRHCIKSSRRVELTDLSCGDVVYLGTYHSFVYLDHDLSLSKFGAAQNLEFHPISVELEKYGCPKDILSKPDLAQEKGVSVLRKSGIIPENILQMAVDYYQMLINAPPEMPVSGERNYDRLKDIAIRIKKHYKEDPKVIWLDLLAALQLTSFPQEEGAIKQDSRVCCIM